MENFLYLNKKLILKGQTVGVALSGGKDSMALLRLLLDEKDSLGISVVALNVDHSIRGESSALDSQFVKDYCDSQNIPLKQVKIDCVAYSKENGMSVEEGARKLRYGFFKDCIKSGFCSVVATAHHMADFAETVLFNLFRGTSPAGLGGIPEISLDKTIIRPILKNSKEQIDLYIEENGIPFVTDESNFETDYSRNFLRLEVIPKIKQKFPEMETAIMRFAEVLKTENEYLNQKAEISVTETEGELSIKTDLPNAIYSRACILAMKRLNIVKDYEKAHIDALIGLKTAETGKRITLPEGVVAIKNYDCITLFAEREIPQFYSPFLIGEFSVGNRLLSIKEGVVDSANGRKILKIDGDKIPKTAVIRYRQKGDVFTKFGGGTKSLGDYLTNKKIPLKDRDFIPVIADGNEILVVCGVEIADKMKISENTKKIISITVV